MDITLQIHLEATDEDIVWWAESDDLPGVTAAAETLTEMRENLEAVLGDLSEERGEAIVVVAERLAGVEESAREAIEQGVGQEIAGGESPSGPIMRSRQILVSVAA